MINEEFTFVVFSEEALAVKRSITPDKAALAFFLLSLAGVE